MQSRDKAEADTETSKVPACPCFELVILLSLRLRLFAPCLTDLSAKNNADSAGRNQTSHWQLQRTEADGKCLKGTAQGTSGHNAWPLQALHCRLPGSLAASPRPFAPVGTLITEALCISKFAGRRKAEMRTRTTATCYACRLGMLRDWPSPWS